MPAIRTGAGESRPPFQRGSPDSLISDPATTSSGSSPRLSSRFIRRDASPTDSLSSLSSLDTSPEPEERKHKEQGPIVIRGQTLRPTIVFNTLFQWLHERKTIDDRRRAGMPAPWTKDALMQKYKFCNAYRLLDRTSQYVITEVIEKGSQDRTELLFRILLFNSFNRIDTWKLLLRSFGGTPTWKAFKLTEYDRVLTAALDRGETLFCGAYMKIGYRLDFDTNHMRHLQLLELLMEALPSVLAEATYAADVYEQIAAFQGMGAFSTYQLMLSLSYSPLLNFAANDFVIPGIGASSGLVKLFGASMRKAKEVVPDIEADVLRWLTETQRAQFARLGLDFPYLCVPGGELLELDVADIEHAVCEVDKYARKAHPHIKGMGDRTQLRGTFHMSEDVLPAVPVLPQAWADPARRVARIREGPLVVEKRWCLLRILAERPAPAEKIHDDEIEYQVSWFGYPDPTWEPRYSILQDAPALVEEYEATVKTTTTKGRRRTKKARR
ncbi:hypothetical protein C8F04DRAFT_1080514 [Mycena alexandri]|uniref:Chromo domain-containing protein n=1 Tax=Mycena alexandri TaxID=1745969 RepID=A0AAD6T9Z8_9AGAR|nr:hypothetical protein C8F04DRAFT_1080514 [Mycena alexandri]